LRHARPLIARIVISATILLGVRGGLTAAAEPTAFEVTFTDAVRPGPISARVYVIFGPPIGLTEPRTGPDWFKPQPFFAVDAKDWPLGKPLTIDAKAAGFPARLDKLDPASYRAQAVVRLNPDTHALDGEGNAYSSVQNIKINPAVSGVVKFTVDKVEPPRSLRETDRIKLVELPSPILSAFHKRPIKHRAAVYLPEGDRSIKRPTLYIIPGFGGDESMIRMIARDRRFGFGSDLIRVVLDPDCGTGHHVFADSATNGPRGEALVKEFIPHLEKTFNAIPEPGARLLNGHSSGGWSSLWLQVTYPDMFGGTWSTSPDPVDFRDFQRIDLYTPGVNFYRQADGSPRPVARIGDKPALFVEPFVRMEEVIGDGGQLSSFEAVFSPLDTDGRPRKLWDRTTGAVDPATAKAWEKYDIRLVLERNWPTIGPKLKGKIHVIMGDNDTFYLEGATRLLKESLAKLGSDAEITLVPGKDHFTIMTADLAKRINDEMRDKVKTYLPEPAKANP
jgi:pimeloyl-ACP methyl ester carboxylesterase